MSPNRSLARRSTPFLATVALLACGLVADSRSDHAQHADHAMTAADMERWVAAWFEANPRRGTPSAGAPVDTFSVFSFGFDNDGNTANGTDTAFVFVGDTVLWRLSDGGHTVTNGTNTFDPQAGQIFDQPINSLNPEFAFQFSDPGSVPFFCRPHDGLMRGVVVVSTPTDVIPAPDRAGRIGFTADPAPNPMRDHATFRFALARAGRVRAEIYDARGRRVAVAVDRMLDAGTWAARWDGRTRRGERAPAGVYWVRLAIPGAAETREIVVAR